MQHRSSFSVYLQSPWTIKDGKAVAPVTIMTEGVHHGSAGPIYWASHILRQNAAKWEGVPVVIDHPRINGESVSVKKMPERIIGYVRKPYFCESVKGIKAEIEIPSNHHQLSQIQNTTEVSAGAFTDEVYQAGSWNGENYHACSITMRPDHLALLPDGKGACSWADGCGVRVHQTKLDMALSDCATRAVQILQEEIYRGYVPAEKLLPPGM